MVTFNGLQLTIDETESFDVNNDNIELWVDLYSFVYFSLVFFLSFYTVLFDSTIEWNPFISPSWVELDRERW